MADARTVECDLEDVDFEEGNSLIPELYVLPYFWHANDNGLVH